MGFESSELFDDTTVVGIGMYHGTGVLQILLVKINFLFENDHENKSILLIEILKFYTCHAILPVTWGNFGHISI